MTLGSFSVLEQYSHIFNATIDLTKKNTNLIVKWTTKAMVDKLVAYSDGTCENFDFEVFESSFEGFQVAGRV